MEALGARGVETVGGGQEKDGLFCLNITVGLCVRPEAATCPLQPPRHPIILQRPKVAEEGDKMKGYARWGV